MQSWKAVLGLFWTRLPYGRAAASVHAVAPHCLRRNPSSAFSGRVTRNEALKPAERHSLFGRIEDNINTTS